EETDEETFRPWNGSLPVDPGEAMYLVRASLTLADARVYQGFLTPQIEAEPRNLGTMQPCLFLPSGKLCGFWDGMFKRSDEDRQEVYAELGSDAQRIF